MTKSPTARLLLGLLITLVAIAAFSSYSLYEINSLRKLQTNIIDIDRHDSLLLIRIQNDVSTIGLRLRDMAQSPVTPSITRYRNDFSALEEDLMAALAQETELHPTSRSAKQQAELLSGIKTFWRTADRVFEIARRGDEKEARDVLTSELYPQRPILSANVSHLLEVDNLSEADADSKIARIYAGAARDTYAFLAAAIVTILGTSLYLIHSNRRIFDQLAALSTQRRVLAAKLISIQEEVLRSVSRELHDEFGQILTAVSTMLTRAERKGVPADSPLRTELGEVRAITHSTLEKIRSLSQMLHPAVIDDYGLAKGIEWYTEVFQRQAGLPTKVTVHGEPVRITGQPAIHCFRIVQEALTNAAKHSGSSRADVELIFSLDALQITVQDYGRGLPQSKRPDKRGLGLIAMRERAELLSGTVDVSSAPGVGTTVSLLIPLPHCEPETEILSREDEEEVLSTRS
ncbi:MAG: sensor histidine kinase [Acidobacteriaceae bacterium]|nr:sensor histidine kinase [Acidobacteriaceae bacterium]